MGTSSAFAMRTMDSAPPFKQRLYRLLDRGEIEVIGHGLYRRSSAPLADLDLIEVAERAPEARLCLISALAEHNLTDIIPAEHDVALPRGSWHPQVQAPVRWHSFASDTLPVGRELLALDDDVHIGIYNAPRTIVDVFRLRSSVGSDVAYEALRRWLRQGGRPSDLLRTARAFARAVSGLRQALEVLM